MARDIREMSHKWPLAGTGLGAFEWVYPMFDHTNTNSTAGHADDEYVELLSEMGLIGTLRRAPGVMR